jgi:predicted aconitase with swiveling domain
MDIDWYLSQDPTGNNGVLRMVNIFGFFIEGMGNVDRNTGAITMAANGSSVIGRIMTLPAEATGASTLPGNASFLVTVRLVR